MATSFISRPHDSARLRKVEREVDALGLVDEQKEYLKAFMKHYGKKEKKRPRDKLLRDRETAPKVLELRKKGAFLGYTYKRMVRKQSMGRAAAGIHAGGSVGKRTVWHRARLSIH